METLYLRDYIVQLQRALSTMGILYTELSRRVFKAQRKQDYKDKCR